MEEGPRKSNRAVKIRQEPGFVYDQDSVQFLTASARDRSDSDFKDIAEEPSWLNLYCISGFANTVSVASEAGRASQEHSVSNTTTAFESPASSSETEVNKLQCDYDDSDRSSRQGLRRAGPYNSSTRLDFVDDFLSVSSSVRTDTSDMPSDTNKGGEGSKTCSCSGDNSCTICAACRQAQMTCTHY